MHLDTTPVRNQDMLPVSQTGSSKKRTLTQAKKILASGISEAEAIERAKQGDGECFEVLYGFHKRRVYSLCLRMTGNTAEAEDLTQEAFLQLYRKIANFSRRVGLFHLVAPAGGERRTHAAPQEGIAGSVVAGDAGAAGRRRTKERYWRDAITCSPARSTG